MHDMFPLIFWEKMHLKILVINYKSQFKTEVPTEINELIQI